MDIAQKIRAAYDFVASKVASSKKLENVSFTAFLVSLLPIPVLSEAASVLDRITAHKATSDEFRAVWGEISKTNQQLASQAESVEKIHEIANTVKFNSQLDERLRHLMNRLVATLANERSEWEVLTKNWSFQAVLNSVVDADYAQIAAINNSSNFVQNTRIHAKKTQLLADNSSSNVVDNSSFHGTSGSVSMNQIRTQGPISVEGSSIGFGVGGSIGFGPGGMVGFGAPQSRPTTAQGTCSQCGHTFPVNIANGVPKEVQCPACKAMLKTS